MFWNFIIGIALFFLQLVLAPKPQNKKAASLEDFNIPVAEEGIEIPVAFGTVYIKSPNVVWYGDLRIQDIKGPRRYGFFGPKQVIGHRYALGMHMVLCHSVHDSILEVWAGEKLISPSRLDGSGVMVINQPEIFGGDQSEGGITGAVDILGGEPTQGQDPYLTTVLAGADTPAFRGVVSVIWESIYVGNTLYIKPWEFKLQRIFQKSNGDDQWYLPKAGIPVDGVTTSDAAFYFAIDTSDSIVGVRMTATKSCLHGAVDYLRAHTDKSYDIRFESFADTVVDSIEFRNASGTDFDDLDTFIDALTATGTGTDFAQGVSDAATFFAGAGSKTRVIIITSDNASQVGDTISGVATAVTTIAGISNLTVNGFRMWGGGSGDLTDSLEQLDNSPTDNHAPGTGGDENPVGEVPIVHFSNTHGLYSALNPAPNTSASYYEMNPAHIIRECLTDNHWGMGYADADIDDDSFTAAADTLYSENFGMSLLWTREEKIEEFISVVLSHIDAFLYLKRTTGKFFLKLIRNDYVLGALPVFDEDDVVSWDEVSRREPPEAVNSVIVKYTDRRNRGKDASISFDNIAQIQALGDRINATRFYPGVSSGGLAIRLAARDQRSLGIGMISGRLTGKRTWDTLYPGDPFRLVTARHNLDGEVMRVASLTFGDGRNNKIGVKFAQDVFRLNANELVDAAEGDWENPANPPAAVSPRLVWEMPYRDLVEMIGPSNASNLLATDPDAGMIEAAGGKPTSDSYDATIYVDGTAEDVMTFAPAGLLDADIGAFDTAITLTDAIDLALIATGELAAIIGDTPATTEIVRVDAVSGNDLTISRGFLDTVPQPHSLGDAIVIYDDFSMSDFVDRTAGDTPDVQLATRTPLGTLSGAPIDEVTLDSRAIRPLRPADAKVEGNDGAAGSADVSAIDPFEVTWANRNRLTNLTSPLEWTDATVALEASATVTIALIAGDGTTIIDDTTYAGLTGTSANIDHADFGAESLGYVRFTTVRDGYGPWQAYQIAVQLNPSIALSADPGSYTFSGTAATLRPGQALIAGASSYAFTGTAATLAKTGKLSAGAGSYTFTGTSATLIGQKKIAAGAGSYAFTGTAATLTIASPAMVYSYEGSTTDNTNATTYTFTNANVGAAGAGRIIALAVATRTTSIGTPRNLSSATCAGNAMTAGPTKTSPSTGGATIGWFYIADATGTTKTFTVTFSGGTQNCVIGVYRLFPVSGTPVDAPVGVIGSATATLSDLEVKTSGLALFVVETGRTATPNIDSFSWSGVDTPVHDLTDSAHDQSGVVNLFSIPTTENDTTRDFTANAAGDSVEIAGISFQ